MAEKLPYRSIKTDKPTNYLYTKGGEYSLNGKEYIGEYHISGDVTLTGPVPDALSQKLRKYYSDNMLYEYDRARGFVERVRIEPNQVVFQPTNADYEAGYAFRYFVERSANFEGYPIEIDRDQYVQYGKEGGIDEAAYSLAIINWKLIGSARNVFRNNELVIKGIFEHNQEEVYKNRLIIPNLETAIKDYLEFANITIS